MLTKLLQIELLLKGGAGLALLLFPITIARIFGLPHGQVSLWPRLLGVLLIGIAGAIYLEHDVEGVRGLGLGGLVLINALAIFALLAITIIQGGGSRRGNTALWLTITILFMVMLLEILQL